MIRISPYYLFMAMLSQLEMSENSIEYFFNKDYVKSATGHCVGGTRKRLIIK